MRVFYGIAQRQSPFIAAQAGIQKMQGRKMWLWVPAFAGTNGVVKNPPWSFVAREQHNGMKGQQP
jgi:hypothetical protein